VQIISQLFQSYVGQGSSKQVKKSLQERVLLPVGEGNGMMDG
jgi:hypothetical protein